MGRESSWRGCRRRPARRAHPSLRRRWAGSKVLIRRVWLGRSQSDLIDAQRAVYESYAAPARSFGDDQTIATDDPEDMVARLAAVMHEVGADALNLRIQLPGMTPAQVREQIEHIGAAVVVPLKALWPAGNDQLTRPALADRRPAPAEMVPAVDVERDSGDLPRVVGQQEAHGGCDVVRLGQPAERKGRSGRGAHVGLPDRPGAVVRTSPGLTAFTRTPRGARSAAIVRVIAFSAALAEA